MVPRPLANVMMAGSRPGTCDSLILCFLTPHGAGEVSVTEIQMFRAKNLIETSRELYTCQLHEKDIIAVGLIVR